MYINGIKASKGYAIGLVYKIERIELKIAEDFTKDTSAEKQRLTDALEKSRIQIISIRAKTLKEIGEKEAAVFDSHLLLLEDPELTDAAMLNISNLNITAEKAIKDITNAYLLIFEGIEDEYMRERAGDIKDVTQRILNNLAGVQDTDYSKLPPNTIIVAHDKYCGGILESKGNTKGMYGRTPGGTPRI